MLFRSNMKRISICSWCGDSFEIEDDEPETDVCGECVFINEDEVGMLDDDDLSYLKGNE